LSLEYTLYIYRQKINLSHIILKIFIIPHDYEGNFEIIIFYFIKLRKSNRFITKILINLKLDINYYSFVYI